MASSDPSSANSGALLKSFSDSGAPPGSANYTTLVIIHGYGYHAGVFKKLIPLAAQHDTRIILVNRRDYPGAVPFSPGELADLAKLASAPPRSPEAVVGTQQVMKDRARELYDYLVELVKNERIPRARGSKEGGGIVLAGWSLGATWISALLSHVADFPIADVRLSEYVKRVVLYDASSICLGFDSPGGAYHPLHDPSRRPEDRMELFDQWVSGYYAHGEVSESGADGLESRNALQFPPRTIANMTAEDIAESTYAPPGPPNGSEALLIAACIAHGTYATLKDGTFYLRELSPGADDWRGVELRYLWCDHSTWEMPWAQWLLSKELEEAKNAGKAVRNVEFVRFRGANHFAHWDLPEKTLRGLLSSESEIQ